MIQIMALPLASISIPITSAMRRPWLASNVHITGPEMESGRAIVASPTSNEERAISTSQNEG